MSAKERCPRCKVNALTARTNLNGGVFLDCICGYMEPVARKADPYPSVFVWRTLKDGTKRKRASRSEVRRGAGVSPTQGVRKLKPREAA